MPTIYNSPRLERVFIAQQSAFRTGAAAGGAKLLRAPVNGFRVNPDLPKTPVPWKTGTRSTQPPILGRKSARWSLVDIPVIPSGTAGTPPDSSALFEGAFGLAGAVAGGVSVTYAFSDTTFLPFTLFSFQHLVASLTQKLVFGCVTEEISFRLNGNVFTMSASGIGVYALTSDSFSAEDTVAKGGYGAYPTEPGSPVTVGTIQTGFGGIGTFDGTAMELELQDTNVRIKTGSAAIGNVFKDAYPAIQVGGERMVSIDFTFVDNDSAALSNLKKKAIANTPMDVTLQVGVIAGNIVSFVMKSFTLAVPTYNDETANVSAQFGESFAHASAIGTIDDVVIVLT